MAPRFTLPPGWSAFEARQGVGVRCGVMTKGGTVQLSDAQRLKFHLLAEGVGISPTARHRLDELRGRRKLTPADYASTSGLILRLADEVWVNAPFADHNGNFVSAPRSVLDVAGDGFVVCRGTLQSQAFVWLPPVYHDEELPDGRPINHFTFTHGDRVRLSPLRGCAMRCKFCNLPYEDPYETKPIDLMIQALRRALSDPLQPAHHVLISGGTPIASDIPFLQEVYEQVLRSFPDTPVDIMMVPVEGLFDLPRLKDLGVNELSINIELHHPGTAAALMPQKHKQGLALYLDFIAEAAAVLGPRRVRSMLMVGLEPLSQTLAGVKAILESGGVPVLSPFRPDPATPLRDVVPPSADALQEAFLMATELAEESDSQLGPFCPPCTHNTLTLVPVETSDVRYRYPLPTLV